MDVNPIVDYDSRGTLAVMRVMLEIGQVLGAFRERFVIIGGSVPWLLYPDAQPPHIGTLDVDLGLDARALVKDDDYVSLVKALENSGFERATDQVPNLEKFELRRVVKVDDGNPIAVIVDLLRPKGKLKKNKPKRLVHFRVQEADGLEVALGEFIEHRIQGTMPDGRPNSVTLRVANIPAFLVMKGYAIAKRNKHKDAYDIYFAVRNFPKGIEALADECRRLLTNPVARKAYENIAEKFESEDAYGPATVCLFLEGQQALGDMTREQLKVDAYQQVRGWLTALGVQRVEATSSVQGSTISLQEELSPADES